MSCAKSLMLWCLEKTQEYWLYVEAFSKRPERRELVQITGENRSIYVRDTARFSGLSCPALAAFLLVAAVTRAGGIPGPSVLDSATPLVIGHALTLHSSVLDEDRRLLIHLPADYETTEQPLPVIYLLDGRAHFNHTTATVDLLGVNARMPRSIVVGIDNTDRSRDFTAVVTEGRSSGGADLFLEFIESELIPFVDGNFRTAPHRTLIGHSLGGSFVVHVLVERPDLFDAAIAISPAVNNDERGEGLPSVSERLADSLENRKSQTFSLFITMSDGEDARWETDLETVIDVLKTNASSSFEWEFRRMEGEDHGTTVHGSTYLGLRFINSDWDTTGLVRNGTLAELVARFDGLSERLGYEIRPPELMVNLLGYRLLGEGRGKEAIEVFEYNTDLYPDSANVDDSLGEALERAGRLPGAMRSYRKAVAKGQASGDRSLSIFQANLDRVEALLLEERASRRRIFETSEGERPDGGARY